MPESRTQTLAKTTRPNLASSVVPRPRLFRRLDTACNGPAVWIHGVPGAGKTCLVSSYVQARGLAVLWYQVDAGDVDLASFCAHLLHAARRRLGSGGGDLPPPPAPGARPAEGTLRQLFRAVYRIFDAPFAFVLDNCQEVPVTSPLHAALALAAEEVPATGTVLFLARHPPGVPMARLRARESLSVIGPDELALTGEEVQAIVEARGARLDEVERQALAEGTRGWAAGLVLMLEHARAGGEVTRTPEGLAPQVLFDYLAGEVFHQFDAAVRDTLCAVSCLRRSTGAQAAAVAGIAQAPDVLHNLARNGYFLNRIDEDEQTWFEPHPLFRNFLAKQAQERFSAAQRARHLERAAQWLHDNDQGEEALRLLAEAGQWPLLADTLARHGTDLWQSLAAGELCRWLGAAPQEVVDAHPWLLHFRARCRLGEDARAARRMFATAYEACGSGGDADADLAALLNAWGALRAVLWECDDLSLADPWIRRLESHLAANGDALSAPDRDGVGRTLHAALLVRGADPGRLQACQELARGATDGDGPAAGAGPLECVAACLQADFATAADLLGQVRAPGCDAAPALCSAFYHLLRGEHEACTAAIAQARAAASGYGARGGLLTVLLAAVESACQMGAGDVTDAGVDCEAALPRTGPARLREALSGYLDGWRLAARGEPVQAFHRLREAAATAEQLGLAPLQAACQSVLAELAAACGDAAAAAQALQGARAAHGAGYPLVDFLRQVAAAEVARCTHDEQQARPAMAAALATGRAHGLRFGLGMRREPAAALCAAALRAGVEPDYVRSLLRAHDLVGRAPAGAPERWPWPVRVATLGGLRVLRHDEPLRLSGKGAGRVLELLKLLAALGGRDVPHEQLAESLWPHVDGDYAYRSFTTTVYRLRKLLDVPDAVLVQEGRVSLNPACCWLDTWGVEELVKDIEAAFWSARQPPHDDVVSALGQDLGRIHAGAFLAGDGQHPAIEARRAQLRRRVQRALVRLAGHWLQRGEAQRAVDLLQQGVDADPLAEGLYRELMLTLESLGRDAEVLDVYAVCRKTLEASGGAQPDERTRAIAERLEASPRD